MVEITFPMAPRIPRGFNNSISIERGPLVFSYGIGESWVKLRDRGMTADWQVFPIRTTLRRALPQPKVLLARRLLRAETLR